MPSLSATGIWAPGTGPELTPSRLSGEKMSRLYNLPKLVSILRLRSFEYFHFGRKHYRVFHLYWLLNANSSLRRSFNNKILQFFTKCPQEPHFNHISCSGVRPSQPTRLVVLWSSRCTTPRSSSLCPAESRSREAASWWPTDPRLTSSKMSGAEVSPQRHCHC